MILDTCALLWLPRATQHFSAETVARINAAPALHVSAISGFEIGIKHRAGKLILPVPPWEWFEGMIAHHGLSVTPLDHRICIKATELPPIHADPCDRFIIATALIERLPVVTTDARFPAYGVQVLA